MRLIHAAGPLPTVLFWSAAIICLVAQAALLRSALRTPAPPASDQPMSATSRASEMAWSILPAVMLALVLLFTWREINRPPAKAAPRMTSASLIAS